MPLIFNILSCSWTESLSIFQVSWFSWLVFYHFLLQSLSVSRKYFLHFTQSVHWHAIYWTRDYGSGIVLYISNTLFNSHPLLPLMVLGLELEQLVGHPHNFWTTCTPEYHVDWTNGRSKIMCLDWIPNPSTQSLAWLQEITSSGPVSLIARRS